MHLFSILQPSQQFLARIPITSRYTTRPINTAGGDLGITSTMSCVYVRQKDLLNSRDPDHILNIYDFVILAMKVKGVYNLWWENSTRFAQYSRQDKFEFTVNSQWFIITREPVLLTKSVQFGFGLCHLENG